MNVKHIKVIISLSGLIVPGQTDCYSDLFEVHFLYYLSSSVIMQIIVQKWSEVCAFL